MSERCAVRPCRTRPGCPSSVTSASQPVASRSVAVVITPRADRAPVVPPPAAGGRPGERPTQPVNDRDRPPPAALGLLRHQTTATRVRLPKYVDQPSDQIDVTDTEEMTPKETRPAALTPTA
jgi:hypothetical protein